VWVVTLISRSSVESVAFAIFTFLPEKGTELYVLSLHQVSSTRKRMKY
jgi:hypothetical protein